MALTDKEFSPPELAYRNPARITMKPNYFATAIILLGWLVSHPVLALELTGQWVQGAMLIGKAHAGERIEFNGRRLRVDNDGVFVFGLGRDAGSSAELTVIKTSGERESHTFAVEQREYAIQRIEGVPPQTVNPPQEQLARIQNESRLTREARAKETGRRDFLQTITWPLLGPITGVYGSQRVYNGEPRRPHFGVDVARPTGTPVVAPLPGVVTLAYDNMFFSGGTLIMDHGHGISSTFIHLSKILVEEGAEVGQGDPIAEVGAPGRVTGPHLDWRMNWFHHPLDPQLLVGPMPDWQQSQ